ncbi:MAG: hypothetical protein C4583_17950 [Anaerolineaceae bacterium]|nr:MAG: hypothetical protein C4583_17950 [Anaerolineaceae bacterium]
MLSLAPQYLNYHRVFLFWIIVMLAFGHLMDSCLFWMEKIYLFARRILAIRNRYMIMAGISSGADWICLT